jgi:type II secretion system protein H
MTSRPGNRNLSATRRRGFTLVEMLLVLSLLTVVIAVAAPTLSRFFQGRYVDTEAQRVLELTRYATSRAVAEGVPMVFWVDIEKRTYGLNADPGFVENDPLAVSYALADNLNLFVTLPDLIVASNPAQELEQQTAASLRPQVEGLLEFRFLPTGGLSEDAPPLIEICEGEREREDFPVRIAPNRNWLYYEIQPRTY